MTGIQKERIDLFFRRLSEELPEVSGTIYVTGGVALILYGVARLTDDIDFEIPAGFPDEKILAIAEELKIPVQFGTDLERWGMTALSEYREKSHFYQRFGNLAVKIVDPLNLIAPKLARFLDRDIEDARILIQKFKISRQNLLDFLEKIYERSPASLEKGLFRRQVSQFLSGYQRELWNKEEPLPEWLSSK